MDEFNFIWRMKAGLNHILFLTFLLFILGCDFNKSRKLPRALTLTEIRAFYPESEPKEINDYERTIRKHGLADLQKLDRRILVDLKYSSNDNFLGYDMYGTLELAYLQKTAALAVVKANKLLMKDNPNLRLLIYDAARPLSVQHDLWNQLDSLEPKERRKYVADPSEASIHNYGCAVDLTIYNLETGRPLDMGTSYDFFGKLAYPELERQMVNEGKLSLTQLNNRLLLRQVMRQAGFSHIDTEWWHFNFYSHNQAKNKYKIID